MKTVYKMVSAFITAKRESSNVAEVIIVTIFCR